MMATDETTPPAMQYPALIDAVGADIPASLVYEILNGKPLYYRGYRSVIEHNLNPETIMGSSGLKSLIIGVIYAHLMVKRDKKRFMAFTNEAGVHVDLGNNFSCDIAIYEKGTFEITTHYFDTAPKIVIEVDIKADTSNTTDLTYITEKTQTLFDFGVERVLWVLSQSRRVFVAAPGQDWLLVDWANDVPVMENITLSVKQLLDDEGIAY